MADDAKPADDKAADLVEDYAQALISVMVSDELLKEIPVVKTIAAAAGAVRAIRDGLLMKKIVAFLDPLRSVSTADRDEMLRRLESDPTYNRKVGLHIIELLDRLESHRKPAMLGYCFAAFADGKLDGRQLQRLMCAIERLPTTEIDSVRRFANSREHSTARSTIEPESIQALFTAGLSYPPTGIPNESQNKSPMYNPTPTCRLFIELVLDTRTKG